MKRIQLELNNLNKKVLNIDLLNQLSLLMAGDVRTIAQLKIKHNLQYFGETMERFDERNLVSNKRDARAIALALQMSIYEFNVYVDGKQYQNVAEFYDIQKKTAFTKLIQYADKHHDNFLHLMLLPMVSDFNEFEEYYEEKTKIISELIKTLSHDELHFILIRSTMNYNMHTFRDAYESMAVKYLDDYDYSTLNPYLLYCAAEAYSGAKKPKKSLFINKDNSTKANLLFAMMNKEATYTEKYKEAFGWSGLTFSTIYLEMLAYKQDFGFYMFGKITGPGHERIYQGYIKEFVLSEHKVDDHFKEIIEDTQSWLDKGGEMFYSRKRLITSLLLETPTQEKRDYLIEWLEEKKFSWEQFLKNDKLNEYSTSHLFNDQHKKTIFSRMLDHLAEQPFCIDGKIPKDVLAEINERRIGFGIRLRHPLLINELLANGIYKPEEAEFFSKEDCVNQVFQYLEKHDCDVTMYDTYLSLYPVDEKLSKLIKTRFDSGLENKTLSPTICSLYLDQIESNHNFIEQLTNLLLNSYFVEIAELDRKFVNESLRYFANNGWLSIDYKKKVMLAVATEDELKEYQLDLNTKTFMKEFKDLLRWYGPEDKFMGFVEKNVDFICTHKDIRTFMLDQLTTDKCTRISLMMALYIRESLKDILSDVEKENWTTQIHAKLFEKESYLATELVYI